MKLLGRLGKSPVSQICCNCGELGGRSKKSVKLAEKRAWRSEVDELAEPNPFACWLHGDEQCDECAVPWAEHDMRAGEP